MSKRNPTGSIGRRKFLTGTVAGAALGAPATCPAPAPPRRSSRRCPAGGQ